MRIITRRRRSTATTMSLSRVTLPPLPAYKPPLPVTGAHHVAMPVVSLTPAVDVEALRQKADMAELEAKSQRSTALKALEYVWCCVSGNGWSCACLSYFFQHVLDPSTEPHTHIHDSLSSQGISVRNLSFAYIYF